MKITCGYRHMGDCSSTDKNFIIKRYFHSGKDLSFCEKHGKTWNDLHLFGPVAEEIKP